MLSTILVPLDGSPLAEHALPIAAHLAKAAGAHLLLARVVGPFSIPETPMEASVSQSAQEYLEKVAARLGNDKQIVLLSLLRGDTPARLLGLVEAQAVGLVVMSTHGRSGIGRLLYGSVADAIMRMAPVPVMLIPPFHGRDAATDRPKRILIPLDGSPRSEAVLVPVADLAAQLSAELLLVNVVAWPPILYSDSLEVLPYVPEEDLRVMNGYLEGVAATLRERGIVVSCHVEAAQTPTTAIIRVAQDEHVDIIAMSTHGRGGLARLVLGSTTTGTLQHAGVPVLVVRPVGLESAESPMPEPRPALAQVSDATSRSTRTP